MTSAALFASIALGSGSLALGYARDGWGVPPLLILFLGAVWLFAQWRGRWHFSAMGLALAVFAAAVGLVLGFNTGWMFAGVLFSLAAWDLAGFRDRMQFASAGNDMPGMERRHLLRLGLLSVVGIILASLPVFVRWRFNFEWLILLALLAALGLSQLVLWFRQR